MHSLPTRCSRSIGSRSPVRVGWTVHREFYVNACGAQTELYADSLAARRAGREPAVDGYHGAYISEWAAAMPADADPLERGLSHAKDHQERSLRAMHVEFDSRSSERDLVAAGGMEETLAELCQRGHAFAEDGATWLRTTDFGDDKDRVLIKADGQARIHAIARMAAERSLERQPLDEVDLRSLVHERELDLLRVLSALPEILLIAANDRAPHKVATWVRELASDFHGFYRDCPVLHEDTDADLRQARLWLVEAARIGLSIGLDILGVSAPEEM